MRKSTVGDVFRAAFSDAVERLVRSDAKLRMSDDAEAIHQARVAVRILRSHLRTFESVLDDRWATALRDRLDSVGRQLGEARDADVMAKRLTSRAGQVNADPRPVLDTIERERHDAYASVASMLRDQRYVALLDDVVEAAKHPRFNRAANARAVDAQRDVMKPVWRRLRKAVRSGSRPRSDRELHVIRIKAKNVRYAAEAFASAAGRRMRRLARAAKRLQTILGDQHDAVVASGLLSGLSLSPEAEFIAGQLRTLEDLAAEDGRRHWKRCWRKLRRARSVKDLHA